MLDWIRAYTEKCQAAAANGHQNRNGNGNGKW